MSKLTIVEGNSNDKDNVRVIMVKGEKGEQGDLNHNDIIDNLTSSATDKVLSANQGKQLKSLVDNNKSIIDEELINIKNDITTNTGNITSLEETLSNETSARTSTDANLQSQISSLASGSPLVASSISGMTDTSRVYVNTTDGHWYYYNGTTWVDAGVYQSTGLDLDTTLTDPNKAPNSKSVGDYVFQNRANIKSNQDRLTNYDGIIKPVNLEVGRITYTQDGGFYWIHDNEGKRCVSTADNTEYHLYPNDIVSLKDYSVYRFKTIYRDMAGTYHYVDWRTTDYIVPVEGYYIFSINRIADTNFDNASEITEQFTIRTNNFEENTYRSMSLSAEDYIKSKLVSGSMNLTSGLYVTQSNRATFYDFIELNKNICITNLNPDYVVSAFKIENGTVTQLPYRGANLIIPANTKFKIYIRKNSETTGEIIPVSELANSIQVYEESYEQIDNIFDERHLQPGYLDGSGNIVMAGAPNFEVTSTIYYEIKEGENLLAIQIINPTTESLDWFCVVIYDEDKNFLSRYSLPSPGKNIKELYRLRPDAKYFKISYRHYYNAKIMVNYGYNFPEYRHYPIEEASRKMYNLSNYGIFGIAHAGGGVAPENTLPAYKLAKQRGFNFAECDIQFTSDNVPVLMHDATVDRTTDGTGRVRQMTYEQIEALNIPGSGEYTNLKVPSFEQFISLCRDIKLIPVVELEMIDTTNQECPASLEILYAIVKKYSMEDRVIFLSERYPVLLAIRDIDPYATLSLLSFDKTKQLEAIYKLNGILRTPTNQVRCSINRSYLNDDTFINACKELDIPMDIWTFYGENGMTNVDGYITGVTSESQRPYEKVIYDANINV